jgi:hypothetical protein
MIKPKYKSMGGGGDYFRRFFVSRMAVHSLGSRPILSNFNIPEMARKYSLYLQQGH